MQQQVCFYLLNCFCSIINLNFEWLLLTIDSPFRPPFPERLGCGAKVFFMILSLLADALLRWNKISVPRNPTSLETVVRRENLWAGLAAISRGGRRSSTGKEGKGSRKRLRNTRRNRIRAEERWIGLENGEQGLFGRYCFT